MTLDTTSVQRATAGTSLTYWRLHLVEAGLNTPAGVVEAFSQGVPTTVPGSVLGTLIDAGLATDVTVDGLEEDVAWASGCTWSYRSTVDRHDDGTQVLVTFEGIDTLATLRVDGEVRLHTDDMFHRWELLLEDSGATGHWTIEVELQPALPVARQLETESPLPRADMYEIPFNQVRKMACSFGWDWGPTTITAGLWREVTVTRVGAARISRALITPDWHHGARITANIDVGGEASTVRLSVSPKGGGSAITTVDHKVVDGQVVIDCEVAEASRWDVVDRGAQPLYDVAVSLLDGEDQILDTVSRQVGFRHLELVQDPDSSGRSFEVHINGSRVWARGFNWIPADVLPERVTRERVFELIAEATATGANMLRVWGGGVVESDDFYDACDEAGLLVWQDFSFACAAYAEDDPQVERVQREVEDAVLRVGHRASLALWCGCNENLWGYEDWGWKEKLDVNQGWGERLYRDVIPAALARLDPKRPYIPGSPFSYDTELHPNDPTEGTTHHWDTWNQLDYMAFEDKSSRFAAEFGWQAPAAWNTLETALGAPPEGADDPCLQRLQKHPEGRSSLARGIADHVPHLPQDGRGWYFATQLMQARAIGVSIGHFRSLHDTCSGALWWQLNDCWPALSWAVIDVTGARRMGWYAAVKVMASRAVLGTAPDTPHALTVVNDVPSAWRAPVVIRTVSEVGEVLSKETVELMVPADHHQVVSPATVDSAAVAVVVDMDGIRATRWITPDLELEHLTAAIRVVDVAGVAGTADVRIQVEALTLVRDLCLLAETHPSLAGVRVDSQLLTVLPGERVAFVVSSPRVAELSIADWAGLLVAGTDLEVEL